MQSRIRDKIHLFILLCIVWTGRSRKRSVNGSIRRREASPSSQEECVICKKSLIFSADRYDAKLQNFLDLNEKEIITDKAFYSHALVKCKRESCGALYHLSCAYNEAKNQYNSAVSQSDAAKRNGRFFCCLLCQNSENEMKASERVLALSKLTQETTMVFRYIISLLISIGGDYLIALQITRPQQQDLVEITANVNRSNSPHKRYLLACIELHCARFVTKSIDTNHSALKNYLAALPSGTELCYPNYIAGYFKDLLPGLQNASTLKACIYEILDAIQPGHREVYRALYNRMLLEYAQIGKLDKFKYFFTECLFSERSFVLRWGRHHENCKRINKWLNGIATKAVKPDAVFLELERRMRNEKMAKEMICKQQYMDIIQIVDMWCVINLKSMYIKDLFSMIKRYFKVRSKEMLVCKASNLNFFSTYKRVCITKNGTVHSFIYDMFISRLFDRLEIDKLDTFYLLLRMTSFYEKRFASKGTIACHNFMNNIANKNYPSEQIRVALESNKKHYEINMLARHLSGEDNAENTALLLNNIEKIVDLNVTQDFNMNATAFKIITKNLQKRVPENEIRRFLEKRLAQKCVYRSLDENTVYEIYSKLEHKDTGLIPLCLSSATAIRTLCDKDVWEWCDSVDLYSTMLGSDILLSNYGPYLKHYAAVMLEYCLEKDAKNEYVGIKGLIMMQFINAILIQNKNGYRKLMGVLFKTKYPYELINIAYHLLNDNFKLMILQNIFSLAFPVTYNIATDISMLKSKIIEEHQRFNFGGTSFANFPFYNKKVIDERFLTFLKRMEELEKDTCYKSMLENSILLAWQSSNKKRKLSLRICKLLDYVPRFVIDHLANKTF
ncbi:hypothetical protein ENBRE01_2259 [Enteropsectra breve]|nr:hypothetical protein ENBRE01_2259 [Enteropsectra breve]